MLLSKLLVVVVVVAAVAVVAFVAAVLAVAVPVAALQLRRFHSSRRRRD